jgi:hypothetical protein
VAYLYLYHDELLSDLQIPLMMRLSFARPVGMGATHPIYLTGSLVKIVAGRMGLAQLLIVIADVLTTFDYAKR